MTFVVCWLKNLDPYQTLQSVMLDLDQLEKKNEKKFFWREKKSADDKKTKHDKLPSIIIM